MDHTMVDTTDSLYNVAFGNGVFVAVGLAGNILTSTNGLDWTLAANWQQRIAVGYRVWQRPVCGRRRVIQSSPDGRAWSPQPANYATDITYGNGRFVAVYGRNSLVSTNGDDWIEGTNGTAYVFQDVAFGGDRLSASAQAAC
jgi:hypothetical protein